MTPRGCSGSLERTVGAQACPFDELRVPSWSRDCAHSGGRDKLAPLRMRRRIQVNPIFLTDSGGFPHARGASGKGMRCRYLLPGEHERSLLKERYLYEDARHISLARWRGQVSAQLCLPGGAGDGIRGYVTGRSAAAAGRPAAAAVDPPSPGERWIFALPAGDRTATVAVRAEPAAGFVDAPCADSTTPASGDGRYCRIQRCFREVCGAVSWFRRYRGGSTSNHTGRGQPDGAGEGPREKGNAGSFA